MAGKRSQQPKRGKKKNFIPDRWQQHQLRRIDGLIAKAVGESAESSVLNALGTIKPGWYISGRKATKEEDHNGIDIVLTVKWWGETRIIPIQIKSSYLGREKHLEKAVGKKQKIYAVIIHLKDSDAVIVSKVKDAVKVTVEGKIMQTPE